MMPDLAFRGLDPETGKPIGPEPPPKIVDLTMRIDEGKQFFVNRITFVGNTTTHDTVVRRDMRLLEGGVFNTEALKDSVRRINQLGYFKPVEKGDAIQVDKTPGVDGKVDITLKVEEQNRNQLVVRRRHLAVRRVLRPAVVPDGELPRPRRDRRRVAAEGRPGEQLPGVVQRAVSVRPAHQRRVRRVQPPAFYPLAYTQNTTGTNTVLGLPLRDYTRAFLGYSYETVSVKDINPASDALRCWRTARIWWTRCC